jgi:hypothetical protein
MIGISPVASEVVQEEALREVSIVSMHEIRLNKKATPPLKAQRNENYTPSSVHADIHISDKQSFDQIKLAGPPILLLHCISRV